MMSKNFWKLIGWSIAPMFKHLPTEALDEVTIKRPGVGIAIVAIPITIIVLLIIGSVPALLTMGYHTVVITTIDSPSGVPVTITPGTAALFPNYGEYFPTSDPEWKVVGEKKMVGSKIQLLCPQRGKMEIPTQHQTIQWG